MKRLFKKCMALLLAALIIFSAVPLGVLAIETYAATYSGKCGENLIWTLNEDTGELSINGTGNMLNWSTREQVPWHNKRIKTISISDGVTSIGDNAFSLSTVKSINFGNTIVEIGDYAFDLCDGLSEVVLPDSLKTIGEYAFADCYNLSKVLLGKSLTTIGYAAFSWCNSISSVFIPKDVEFIDEAVFASCFNLSNIDVDISNAFYSSDESGVLFNKNKTALIQYPIGKKQAKYTVPDSVTTVGNASFLNSQNLENIVIGNNVSKIGVRAFSGCSELTNIVLGKSVKEIEFAAFEGCYYLMDVSFGDSVLSIGPQAFKSCQNLREVNISSSVKDIAVEAFSDCFSLQKFNVSADNRYYFSDSTGVLYNKDKTTLICYPCGNNTTNYSILPETTHIEAYAFYGVQNLKNLTIPKNIKNVGDYALLRINSDYDSKPFENIYFDGTIEEWNRLIPEDEYFIYTDNITFTASVAYNDKITAKFFSFPTSIDDFSILWTTKNSIKLSPSNNLLGCSAILSDIGKITITSTIKDKNSTFAHSTNYHFTVEYTWWQWIIVILLFGWIWY
ncbi:MAG: leucine-rich repeat domain-containing protein [Clostridia bacterium]|nr:leucine-rich repeat domain-containing protein [Clostridia bacterium]